MKKLFSIILMLSLVLGLSVIVSATEIDYVADGAVEVKAIDVSENILGVLRENGAKIEDNSLLKVLPVENSADTAICVTNVDGDIVEQDIFMAYTEDESGNMVVDNSIALALAQGSDHNMSGSYPPIDWDGRYIVNATATAAKYFESDDTYGWFPYYKPYKCSFNYVNYSNVTVNSIEVRYITEGAKYSYPGFTYMNSSYEHTVTAYKSNPSAGVTYTGYNYFPESFVLSCTGTEDMVLTFINRVNGVTDTYTVKLTNSY